jgi:3-deoxy-manno-octulosonate cytidylyltransferase (CMP-KDO synthetase)
MGPNLNVNNREYVIVIPARMGGSRLPGKPLILINNKPMIHHVWDRCKLIYSTEEIFVATEDIEIFEYCKMHNIQCVMTPKAQSAIDRIYYFSQLVESKIYINVQGDEPIINIKDVKKVIEYSKQYPNRVVIGKTKASESEFNDISKAKVVCDNEGRLLYSSRAGIPISSAGKYQGAERAIWIYAFPAKSLIEYFHASNSTKLDVIEDNEILRFLEIGVPVYCINVIGDSWAVDELKDLKIIEERLAKLERRF